MMTVDILNLPQYEDMIPEGEVVAFSPNGCALVGTISKNEDGSFFCEGEESLLEDVTHFMVIPIFE